MNNVYPPPYATMRQIHLDFHTPGFVTVGQRFDAQHFFDTLEAAEVNAIAVFALCHHGYSYFNTRTGQRHPGLNFDLLGAMAQEADKRAIQLLAYFSMNVNEVQAERHPEWHALRKDGRSVNSQILQDGSELYWTWLCPNRPGLLDQFFHPHVQEVLDRYPLDGIFIDMAGYLPESCFCSHCLEKMRRAGQDPDNIPQHQAFNAATHQAVAVELRRQLDRIKPGLRLEIGCYNAFGEAHKAKGIVSDLYLESLAFQTGWQYFPLFARYLRRQGIPVIGYTGRFLKNWGDFGTVTSTHQLKTQVAMHLMAGVASGIGDHMHCNGELDAAVYAAIGEAFRFIKPRQPYCVGMIPVRELAILVPKGIEVDAATLDHANPFLSILDAYKGAAKLATELHYQYDLVTQQSDLNGFSALMVNDGAFDLDFVRHARRFAEAGGWVIVGGFGLCPENAATRRAWNELTGVTSFRLSDHEGEFYQLDDPRLMTHIPPMAHRVHARAIDAEFAPDITALATVYRSPVASSREHHYGHFHGPADSAAGPAIGLRRIGQGGCLLIRPQIFTAYLQTGYWVHRQLIRNLLDAFLPTERRRLATNAPSIVEVALGWKEGRYIIQALPFVSDRRDRHSFESLNEPVPFHDIWIDVFGIRGPVKAYEPVSRAGIACEPRGRGMRLVLPPFAEHVMVVVENADGHPLPAVEC